MPTLTGSASARTWTLCALYCAQGMPWGFVTITLLAYVADRGASLEQTANIVALATLPWSFKILWGVLIDRFTFRPMGRRRPWVLLAQVCMGASLLAMILVDDLSADVEALAWMVFVHNCFVSLQDVGSDALAVDVLTSGERGRVNGLMWASNNLGVAIGGAGMGTVLARYGVQAAFTLQVSVLFAIALFPFLIRERPGERLLPWTKGAASAGGDGEPAGGFRSILSRLVSAFRSRGPAVALVFSAASSVLIGMMVAVNPTYFTQGLGWDQETYSQFAGGIVSITAVLGALTGGFLVDRLGVRKTYTWAALLIVGICLGLGVSEGLRSSRAFCMGYMIAVEFLVAAQTVVGFSLYMRLCAVAVAGTQFTLFMATTNFARVGGAKIVSALGDDAYASIFTVMALSMLISVPVLYAIPERESGS